MVVNFPWLYFVKGVNVLLAVYNCVSSCFRHNLHVYISQPSSRAGSFRKFKRLLQADAFLDYIPYYNYFQYILAPLYSPRYEIIGPVLQPDNRL